MPDPTPIDNTYAIVEDATEHVLALVSCNDNVSLIVLPAGLSIRQATDADSVYEAPRAPFTFSKLLLRRALREADLEDEWDAFLVAEGNEAFAADYAETGDTFATDDDGWTSNKAAIATALSFTADELEDLLYSCRVV